MLTKYSELANFFIVEEQKHTTSPKVAEESNQKEELLLQQELELQSVVFNRIYQRNTGEEVRLLHSEFLFIIKHLF